MRQDTNGTLGKKKHGVLILGIVLASVAVMVGAAVLIMMLVSSNKEKQVQEQCELGEEYLEDEEYEDAVECFEAAIEMDLQCVDAYLGLADAYIAMNEYEDAIEILEDGYDETDASKIRRKLRKLEEMEENGEFVKADAERAERDEEGVAYAEETIGAEATAEEAVGAEVAAEEARTEGDSQNNSVIAAIMYEEKLQELASQYGSFISYQSGVMEQMDTQWLEPGGILGSAILDFDADGTDELLICYSKKTEVAEEWEKEYKVKLEIYDMENGKIVLADSIPLAAYSNDISAIGLTKAEWNEVKIALNVVNVGGYYYLVGEEQCIASSFADGQFQNYWIMEYRDGMLNYVGSFTQTGGGSAEFEYIGFMFENGFLMESILYYSEIYEATPLYTDFDTALAAFYESYGIGVEVPEDCLDSILSGTNDVEKVFHFRNQIVERDYSNYSFTFEATLEN